MALIKQQTTNQAGKQTHLQLQVQRQSSNLNIVDEDVDGMDGGV